MWYDQIPDRRGWCDLWSDLILCGCGGIRRIDDACNVCDSPPPSLVPTKVFLPNGREVEVVPTFPGAEGRYEDYVYLSMLQREWERRQSPHNFSQAISVLSEISAKASVVLLYWTYFETRIGRLIKSGMDGIPDRLKEDTLNRYSSVGARITKLYKIIFGVTYEVELSNLGHGDLWKHVKDVWTRRNRFAHGDPTSIDDSLVEHVVENIKLEHEVWIEVFNLHLIEQRKARHVAAGVAR